MASAQRTLADWLTELESRHFQEIQLGLDRMKMAANKLDLLNLPSVVISVAGTNGKGSTVAALEAIYTQAGYCTAAYTSPHLLRFNERIKLNRQQISDNDLIHIFERIEMECRNIPLTYFEVATLAALVYFKEQKPDVIILETGLGGRLDATNCWANDLAIITTIDLDHQAFLGETREEIGFEKAGILRKGKPFIFADKNIPDSVWNQAISLETDTYRNGINYSCSAIDTGWKFMFNDLSMDFAPTKLHTNSLAAAIMATIILQDRLPVNRSTITDALNHLTLAGRLQLVDQGEWQLLFDVSHNPQSVHYLAEFISQQQVGKVHAVFSALSDKNLQGMLEPMRPLVDYWYPALLDSKRAITAKQLLGVLNDNKIKLCHNTPLEAYQTACQAAHAGDLIVVFGSFITVAAVMSGAI